MLKNIFKGISAILLGFILLTAFDILFFFFFPSIRNIYFYDNYLASIIEVFFFIFSWFLLFKDNKIKGNFFTRTKYKKACFIIILIFILFPVLLVEYLDKKYDPGTFLPNSIYENNKFGFKIIYPEGSKFANAHQELGWVTRFFLPNGKTLSNDTENIGVYIKYNAKSLDDEVQILKDSYSKNGSIDIIKFDFGGQDGYRLILTTNYTSSKNTREAFYVIVKDNTAYELNYFPVIEENLPAVDKIVKSFEFLP